MKKEYSISLVGDLDLEKTKKKIAQSLKDISKDQTVSISVDTKGVREQSRQYDTLKTKMSEINRISREAEKQELKARQMIIEYNKKDYNQRNQKVQKLQQELVLMQKQAQAVKESAAKTMGSYKSGDDSAIANYEKNASALKKQHNELKGITNEVRVQESEVKSLDKFWGNMGYQWKKAFTSFSMYLSVTTVFYKAAEAVRSMISEVTELDSSLVELRKVTDLEGSSLDAYVDKAYAAGEALAKTGKMLACAL